LAQECIAVYIVNLIAPRVMLLGSDEPDRSQLVHGHLGHASEDVFTANADTAAQLEVSTKTQGMPHVIFSIKTKKDPLDFPAGLCKN
jgi:hypothetical protein